MRQPAVMRGFCKSSKAQEASRVEPRILRPMHYENSAWDFFMHIKTHKNKEVHMRERWEIFKTTLTEQKMMTKKEFLLIVTVCVLFFFFSGMMISPRKQVTIGSHNGSNNQDNNNNNSGSVSAELADE